MCGSGMWTGTGGAARGPPADFSAFLHAKEGRYRPRAGDRSTNHGRAWWHSDCREPSRGGRGSTCENPSLWVSGGFIVMSQQRTQTAERILIVDDEDLIVGAMRRYFQGLGYTVDSAYELEEALALLGNYQYDLVIADLRLTAIGGVEGLQIVADVHQKFARTRVILLSAFGTPEIERESYNRGADAFLHKPKAMMEIAQVAKSLLEQ